jgi:hypothetical protein
MRRAVLGSVVLVGCVIAAVAATPDRPDGIPPRGVPVHFYPNAANSDLIVVSANVRDQYQQLTIIDPKSRRMAVYHADFATGVPVLRATRHFEFDLELEAFNGKDPLPDEIRTLLSPK